MTATTDGPVVLSGLRDASLGELVRFEGGAVGRVVALERRSTRVEMLDPGALPSVGEAATATASPLEVVVGDGALGRVVDALGRPLDAGPPLVGARRRLVEPVRPISQLTHRGARLRTGVRQLDLLAPLCVGEAVGVVASPLGGKTCLAVDIAAAQVAGDDARCVYVCPGLDRAASVTEMLRRSGALSRAVVVSAPASSPPLTRLAPRAGVAMARAFADAGRPTLVVWDEVAEGDEAQEVTEYAGAWSGGAQITALALARRRCLVEGRVDHLLALRGRSFLLDLDVVEQGVRRDRYTWEGRRLRPLLRLGEAIEAVLRADPTAPLDEPTLASLATARRVVREVLAQPPHTPEPIERALVRLWCAFAGTAYDEALFDALHRAHGPLLAEVRRRGRLTEELARELGAAVTALRRASA